MHLGMIQILHFYEIHEIHKYSHCNFEQLPFFADFVIFETSTPPSKSKHDSYEPGRSQPIVDACDLRLDRRST